MSKQNDILQLVIQQIVDGTDLVAAEAGSQFQHNQTPYAGIHIGGGDLNPDANGILDEILFMTIVITTREIEEYYTISNALKVMWLQTNPGVEFHALRDAGVIWIKPFGPTGYPLTIPVGDNDNIIQGGVSFKLMTRANYA